MLLRIALEVAILEHMNASDLLKAWLDRKGYSQKRLAAESGLSENTISFIKNRHTEPETHTIKKISKALGITVDQFWLGPPSLHSAQPEDETSYIPYLDADKHHFNGDTVFVPHYRNRVSAGNGVSAAEPELKRMLPFNSGWVRAELGANPSDLVMVDVYGDSMEPTLYDGDQVLVDRRKRDLREHGLYVFRVEDELFVKRSEYQYGRVLLVSDNSRYKPFYLDEARGEAFGRVVWRAGKTK